MKKEYILCAAYHFQNGKKYEEQPKNIESGFVSCGHRHGHAATIALAILKPKTFSKVNNVSGFLTSKNRFVDRYEGAKIAFKAGQIKIKLNLLISEDLY